jgi:uncharacterized protein
LSKEEWMPVSPELMEMLACPKCKGELKVVDNPDGFLCEACRLIFGIEDGIPNFLIEEAIPVSED